jgi:hypothetical protein
VAARVYLVEDGFGIKGAEPPGLRARPEAERLIFWGWMLLEGLAQKDRDLARGLDKDGKPLRPIRASTRKHRRSAMTPSGKGDPLAPPLSPGRHLSRVRSLLTGRAYPDRVEFWWNFDPFTGESFAKILDFQKGNGRDVFGLSPVALKRTVARAWDKYKRWQAGEAVELPKAIAIAMAKPIVAFGKTDLSNATLGINTPASFGQWSGGMRAEDLAKHFRQPAKVSIPGRPGTKFNKILGHIYGQGPAGPVSPKIAGPKPPKPPTVPKPIIAKATPKPMPKPPPPAPKPAPPTIRPVARAERAQMAEAWHAKMAGDEESSISHYVGNGYLSINPYLRIGRLPPGMTAEEITRSAARIDRALAKARLERAIVVYRGIRDIRAIGLDPENLVGATIADMGFLSTSFDRHVAFSFTHAQKNGAIIRIHAPAGSHGGVIGELANLNVEQEVLFPRRSVLRITTAVRGVGGRWEIDAEFVHE